jgi:hypothetical protein
VYPFKALNAVLGFDDVVDYFQLGTEVGPHIRVVFND